ncbi:MAG: hypothetical protein JXA60_06540 [Candidatus Coatesbacteria bacterium]|nr:hypothetical protein [Candidatus Coatesbacteria bacterium]
MTKLILLCLLIGSLSAKPYTDISQIRAGQYTNPVIVHAVVSVPTGRFGADIFYIQDSNAGIKCIDATKPSLQLGNEVEVLGNVYSSQGELTIEVLSVQTYSEAVPPSPAPLSTSQAGQETYEGLLVIVGGMITKVNIAESLVCIDDGSGGIWIWIDPSTGIDVNIFGLGEKYTAIGVISQSGNTYYLLPRFSTDIKKGGSINKATWGQIKKLYQNRLAQLRKKRVLGYRK